MNHSASFSLMIHGGAGSLGKPGDDERAVRYQDSLRRILERGRAILTADGSALQAVETCAALLEDDPIFNAGRGAVLNADGKVELDAAIMDGRDLSAGAVAGVVDVANPVRLARRVMTDSGHVMLIGEGATRFARRCGMPTVPEDYFQTPERLAQWQRVHRKQTMQLDHDTSGMDDEDPKHGTIGAVARDRAGNLAAATSTGGVVNQRPGRVGDSPIIGAGVYADNESCAVSATGHGEDILRCVLARTIVDFMLLQGLDAEAATRAGIAYFRRKVQGRGGVIVIDRHGNCARAFTTPNMIHGWIAQGGEAQVSLG
jgi:beta-aspartyl-peptidase (threonine type)